MKDLLFLIPSYIKDSKDLLTEIKQMTLPQNAKLFTADALVMYTNIDTNTGITAFENLFHD
jgi:protein subunit release factor A